MLPKQNAARQGIRCLMSGATIDVDLLRWLTTKGWTQLEAEGQNTENALEIKLKIERKYME